VQVLLPAHAPEAVAHALVREKAGWVRRKLAEFLAADSARERCWTDGGTLPWLGREYPLRIIRDTDADEAIARMDDGGWRVCVPASTPANERRACMARALRAWCIRQAEEYLPRMAWRRARVMGARPMHVGVKGYRSRWGSCHADGRVYFNWRLMLAPVDVIDYVVVHELCHLTRRDHSPAFWALVARWRPDWRERRLWLRRRGHGLAVLDGY